MKVLITGGAGFIGSNLADELVKKKHQVTSIDQGGLAYRNPSVKYITANLRDYDEAIKLIRDCDIVFHLASNYSVMKSTEDPKFDFENNILLTFNVLDAMRKNHVKKIVFASTSAVYGIQKTFPIKEDFHGELRPISNYAASKLASEIYIHSFSSLYGIEGLVLRLANIVGPRSNHGIVPDLVRKIKKDSKRLEVFGNGQQKKSYIHISDCVDAMVLSSEKFSGFDVFNVGCQEWISVDEIVNLVCKEMDAKPKIEYTGGKEGWTGDVPEFQLDISKIRSLGWKQKMNTREAIIDAIRWNRQNQN